MALALLLLLAHEIARVDWRDAEWPDVHG